MIQSPPRPVTAQGASTWGLASVFAHRFPLVAKAAPFILWIPALAALNMIVRHFLSDATWGQDSHAYWLAAQGSFEYGTRPGQPDAYLYSPAFLQIIRPVALLPWPAFSLLWTLFLAAVLFWLIRPLPLRFAVPVAVTCLPELIVGNIYLLLGAAAALAVRRSGVWAFPILTKVTTGVGLLWHVARRDWRGAAWGAGVTALIVLVSALISPQEWIDWIRFLITNRSNTPDSTVSFVLRCLTALALTLMAARKGWAFLLAPAVMLAAPVFTGPLPLMTLVAVPRLLMADTGRVGPAGASRPDVR